MTIRTFETLPKPYASYPKALLSLSRKATSSAVLPDVEYLVPALRIDAKHLAAYNEVCGFRQKGVLPPTYLAVLSQALQIKLMTSEDFPFALLGLVHIRNRIKQYKPIQATDAIALSCKAMNLRPHDKGLQFDFFTTAKVNGDLLWECDSTYLARMKTPKTGASEDKQGHKQEPAFDAQALRAQFDAQENIGRRYAAVSGDFNPIHIHPLSAKFFGFKTAIAHGMWTKARCLAEMGDLPAAFETDVQFKLPVFLPAKLAFQAQMSAKGIFELKDAATGKPHIFGVFQTE